MSLIIKAKFFNKSNNVIIDYSEKKFTRNQKEVFESGTLYRKGTKLSYKYFIIKKKIILVVFLIL